MTKERRYEKVVEGETGRFVFRTIIGLLSICGVIFFISKTQGTYPLYIVPLIFILILCTIITSVSYLYQGIEYFLERKVYWREIK